MKQKRFIMVLMLAMAMLMTTACSKEAANTPDGAVASTFKAGTYTATADGFGGPLTVEVVFSDEKIDSVTVKEHKETAGVSDPAIEKVPAAIVEAQSLDVDTVAGATMSSRGIKHAVADAVKQAGGENNPLLDVDLDRANASEEFFAKAVESIVKPEAVNGVIEVESYDELKKALGYYAYIVYPETNEGKFIYVDGSAIEGDTVKLMSDLQAEGEKDNPKLADGSDKAEVITGATLVVTENITIEGNGKTVTGGGYPLFMFTGGLEDFENGAIEATMKNIKLDDAAYTAKLGGAVYVVGAAELNLKNSTISNGIAKSEKHFFNGGGAVHLNSHGLAPEVGRAILNATNCTFTGNSTANGAGGAVYASNADVNIIGSTFNGNKALNSNGSGGAIAMNSTSNLLIDSSTITGNEAKVSGGGVYIFEGNSLTKGDKVIVNEVNAVIKNSTIEDNTAQDAADVSYGRFYAEGYEGDKTRNTLDISAGNTIGEFIDIIFANLERTEVVK